MADKIKIDDESDFAYNITDSEDNYSEDEKELLEEVQKSQRKEKSKVEDVLAFTESEAEDDDYDGDDGDIDSEEDAEDMADSDIERARESDLNDEEINTKYWGKTKRNYYNTDFVDQDYSSYNEKEEELAKMEEEEANNIRLRLIKELKEEDFLLDTFSNKTSKETQAMEVASSSSTFPDEKLFSSVQMKADFTKLTKRERLQLFEKDSPEFAALIGDLENYLDEIRKIHNPVLEYCHQNDVPMIPALRFTQHYQNIVLTYCNNLMFYLLLKCACTASVQHHPVIKRLNQLKKLLNQLDDKHENIIKPQLEALLERIIDGDNFKILEQTNTEVKMSTKKMEQKAKKMNGEMSMNKKNVKFIEKDPMKNTKHNNQCKNNENDNDYMDSVDDNLDENDINENIEDGNADEYSNDDDFNKDKVGIRRGITYEIAKNKGLTPHRKKEQRNPRVKHRGKYRKALIRRKGAIRNVRKEIKRYNGEISGIKATVSKSIKFKT